MRIAIDCRYLAKSGIGRVLDGFLESLDFEANEYYLIGKPAFLEAYKKAHIVPDESEPFSYHGLRTFDKRLNSFCDALIIPNFIIPFGVKIPVHTIMHDLIFLDLAESTRGETDAFIKKTLIHRCMKKSATIACVSEFTLSRCEYHYPKLSKKCYVCHNGITHEVLNFAKAHPAPEEKGDYYVFVGNVKKHKGLELLLDAFEKLDDGTTLKVIGEKGHFLTGLKVDEGRYKNVTFTGRLTDGELFSEIQNAKYLILPSKYEGFGLPPLEAMCLGTQPIVSDIPVFREVYKGLPVKYFHNETELMRLMKTPPDKIDVCEEIAKRYDLTEFTQKILSMVEGKRS